MNLNCPKCSYELGYLDVFRFIRLHSVVCLRCKSPLVINGNGRTAIILSPLLAFLVGMVFQKITGLYILVPVAVIAGFIVAPVLCARLGRVDLENDDLG